MQVVKHIDIYQAGNQQWKNPVISQKIWTKSPLIFDSKFNTFCMPQACVYAGSQHHWWMCHSTTTWMSSVCGSFISAALLDLAHFLEDWIQSPNLVKSIMPMKCGTQAGKSYSWAWSAKCSITDLCQQGGNPYCIILCFCQRTSNCISKETTCPEKMRERAFPNTVLTRNYAPPFCWLGLATSMGGGGVGGLIIEYV